MIVGVRGDDGNLQLLHEPVTEEGLVRKAVSTLVPKKRTGRVVIMSVIRSLTGGGSHPPRISHHQAVPAALGNAQNGLLVVTPVPKVPFWKLSNFNELQPTFSTTY